ncbi:YbaN family protein [Fusobacterium sp. MFO224]|uniref:YbaN family protein n=1 Tax=Fusobacterium sp. MFO224 TaxID=3378070 RepID=UPI0038525EA3
MKKLLFVSGIISLLLGGIGIVLPLLPTTPFLLVSCYCFSKSSDKLYKYLTENKIFGQYIKDYKEKQGITLKNKISALIFIFLSIGYSLYRAKSIHLKGFLIIVLICVSYHILSLKIINKKIMEV